MTSDIRIGTIHVQGNEMLISQIAPHARLLVELPNQDGIAVLCSEYMKAVFIKSHGDVAVIYDKNLARYIVPAFSVGRKEYSDMKQRDCNRYGCN